MNYSFCPMCGGRVRRKDKVLFLCGTCGFHLYDNPKFTVSVIIQNDKGEILFAKRNQEPGKGTWNTPGGFVDPGESLETAARREVREETGISLRDLRYFGSHPDWYRFNGVDHRLIAITFLAAVGAGRMRAGDDASALKFFAPHRIPFRNMGIPSDKAALRDYLRSGKL